MRGAEPAADCQGLKALRPAPRVVLGSHHPAGRASPRPPWTAEGTGRSLGPGWVCTGQQGGRWNVGTCALRPALFHHDQPDGLSGWLVEPEVRALQLWWIILCQAPHRAQVPGPQEGSLPLPWAAFGPLHRRYGPGACPTLLPGACSMVVLCRSPLLSLEPGRMELPSWSWLSAVVLTPPPYRCQEMGWGWESCISFLWSLVPSGWLGYCGHIPSLLRGSPWAGGDLLSPASLQIQRLTRRNVEGESVWACQCCCCPGLSPVSLQVAHWEQQPQDMAARLSSWAGNAAGFPLAGWALAWLFLHSVGDG